MSWDIAKDARLLSAECLRLNLADTRTRIVRSAWSSSSDKRFVVSENPLGYSITKTKLCEDNGRRF